MLEAKQTFHEETGPEHEHDAARDLCDDQRVLLELPPAARGAGSPALADRRAEIPACRGECRDDAEQHTGAE